MLTFTHVCHSTHVASVRLIPVLYSLLLFAFFNPVRFNACKTYA